MGISPKEIEDRFGYHPPRSKTRVGEHESAREMCRSLAEGLNALLPDDRPREKAQALTAVEDAMLHANACLARAEDPWAEVSDDEAAAGPRD